MAVGKTKQSNKVEFIALPIFGTSYSLQ